MTRLAIIAAVLALTGCKVKIEGPLAGRCEVLRYQSGSPLERRCAWRGYWWTCTARDCRRGDALAPEER